MKLNRHCCGFSLVELVTSLAIISILMVAMGSAVVIAARGLPDPTSPFAQKVDAAQVVGQLANEVAYATAVLTASPTELEFVVDRNGTPITIHYDWDGDPGDPLIRVYNDGPEVTVIEHVQAFTLTYNLRAPEQTDEPTDVPEIEGPEELFMAQDESNSGTADDFTIETNAQCAEYFKPVLPSDAISWRITRVKFIANPDGRTKGILAVEVMTVNSGSGTPNNTVDSVLISEKSLVANNWHEVQFTDADGLSPSDAYFIVFSRASGGGTTALIRIGTGSLNSPDTTYWYDVSGTWVEDPTTDIWLWVWGKVTVPDPPPLSEGGLSSVRIELQVGTDTSTKTQTQVQVLNAPEISGL